jgi:hydrogenase nickel incorporation protein HypA/HybF
MREIQSIKAVIGRAFQQVQRINAVRVRNVHLVLGEMAGLDLSMIQHHWDELSKGTPLEHARINFRSIIAEAQCMACFGKYRPENGEIHCPYCGSFGAKILTGEEFHFESIETDNE